MASLVLALGIQEGDAGSPPAVVGSLGKASIPNRRLPSSPHHIPTLPIGRSRISSSAGVYCCPQPGPGSCQHLAKGGRKGCSLGTASQLAWAVASWNGGEASEHLGHQRTVMSLPAGVRGHGEVTLPFPYPSVTADNLPRKMSSPRGSMQRPEEDIGGTMPCPACHIPLWVPAVGCRAARLPTSL